MSIRTKLKKVLPSISTTEQEALDAGDVWLEGSIYQGVPDFAALRDIPVATLSADEQSFLDGPVQTLIEMVRPIIKIDQAAQMSCTFCLKGKPCAPQSQNRIFLAIHIQAQTAGLFQCRQTGSIQPVLYFFW